jgi:hypothetical protein
LLSIPSNGKLPVVRLQLNSAILELNNYDFLVKSHCYYHLSRAFHDLCCGPDLYHSYLHFYYHPYLYRGHGQDYYYWSDLAPISDVLGGHVNGTGNVVHCLSEVIHVGHV